MVKDHLRASWRTCCRVRGMAAILWTPNRSDMQAEYATPADFTAWEAKAKTMTFRELVYTVRDC